MSLTIQQGLATSSSGGISNLGNKTTTSGSSASLTGLTLTSYKFLRIVLNAISINTNTAHVEFNSNALTANTSAGTETTSGFIDVDLSSGRFVSWCDPSGTGTVKTMRAASGMTTASTSVTLTTSTGNFDAGSFDVYGYA